MKRSLVFILFVLLSLILVFTLIGCGGGSDKNTGVTQSGDSYNNEFDKGGLSITVNWPAGGKAIPSATTKIKVNIYESSGGHYQTVVPETIITRESGASSKTATINGIPLGAKIVLAQAYDSSDQELAYATQNVTIHAGNNPAATLTLADGVFPGFNGSVKYAYVVNQIGTYVSRNKSLSVPSVSKIKQSNYAVANTISLPDSVSPFQAAITSDGSKVLITDTGANKIHIINTSDDTVTSVTAPGATNYIIIEGNYAYISAALTAAIYKFNITNNTISTFTSTSGSAYPKGIAYYNSYLYGVLTDHISTRVGFKVNVADPSIGDWSDTLNYDPAGPVAINTNRALAYIPASDSYYGGFLTIVNTGTGSVVNYMLSYYPHSVVVSPDQTYVYITDITNNKLYKYLASNLTINSRGAKSPVAEDNVDVGLNPLSAAISSDGEKVWVANNSGGTVSVVDASVFSVLSTITVGNGPAGIALQP